MLGAAGTRRSAGELCLGQMRYRGTSGQLRMIAFISAVPRVCYPKKSARGFLRIPPFERTVCVWRGASRAHSRGALSSGRLQDFFVRLWAH